MFTRIIKNEMPSIINKCRKIITITFMNADPDRNRERGITDVINGIFLAQDIMMAIGVVVR